MQTNGRHAAAPVPIPIQVAGGRVINPAPGSAAKLSQRAAALATPPAPAPAPAAQLAPGARLLTPQEVAKKFSVNVRTVWRWESVGIIPRGIRISRGVVRWKEDAIDRCLELLAQP
jgi:predicted DNA-binding transcriptional regulator AlpA